MITYHKLQVETDLLGKREALYLACFSEGQTAKQVAKQCGVSPHTVAGAAKRILYKLNADRMAGAISNAWAMGLIRQLMICCLVVLTASSGVLPSHEDEFIRRTRTYRRWRESQMEDSYVAASA
nr:hypothetical protein 5 [Saccharospirillaceae bacterium]